MLNNQPMGFYNPATLVKDAQRHGLRVRPIDVTCSDWLCTLEKPENKSCNEPDNDGTGDETRDGPGLAMRLGLRYVKGLRADAAAALAVQRAIRPFVSIEDLQLRVPALQKTELTALAEVGALNFIAQKRWRGAQPSHPSPRCFVASRACLAAAPALYSMFLKSYAMHSPNDGTSDEALGIACDAKSPLLPMTVEERLMADFQGTGMTVGPHPLAYHRAEMKKQGVRAANELANLPNGSYVRDCGCRHSAPAARHCEGFCIPQPGR